MSIWKQDGSFQNHTHPRLSVLCIHLLSNQNVMFHGNRQHSVRSERFVPSYTRVNVCASQARRKEEKTRQDNGSFTFAHDVEGKNEREKKRRKLQKRNVFCGAFSRSCSLTSFLSLRFFTSCRENTRMAAVNTPNTEMATFGAGCFWSTEKCFRNRFGAKLITAVVGYVDNSPASGYDEVRTHAANHVEVLRLSFEPRDTPYSDLVQFFFTMHDPTISKRHDSDRFTQYRSVIFTHTKEQQKFAEQVRDGLQASDNFRGRIITQIQPAEGLEFRIAEPKHQNYLQKNYGWLKQT